MRLPLTLALLALALPAPVLAAAADPQPEASPAPAQAAKAKKICRKNEYTGSRMGKSRTCLTAEQWEELDETARRDMLQRQRELNQQ